MSTFAMLLINEPYCIVLLFREEITYSLSPSRISAFMSFLCTHHSSCEEPVSQKMHYGSLHTCTLWIVQHVYSITPGSVWYVKLCGLQNCEGHEVVYCHVCESGEDGTEDGQSCRRNGDHVGPANRAFARVEGGAPATVRPRHVRIESLWKGK